jgi:hypothetical protein
MELQDTTETQVLLDDVLRFAVKDWRQQESSRDERPWLLLSRRPVDDGYRQSATEADGMH